MISRAAVDYIMQLKTTFHSYMTNRLLLNVDMTVILLIKVDLHYDDNNDDHKKHMRLRDDEEERKRSSSSKNGKKTI